MDMIEIGVFILCLHQVGMGQWCMSGLVSNQFRAQHRSDPRAEHFDGSHQLRMRKRSRVHLKCEARDAAQRMAMPNDLLNHFVGAPNEQCAVWASLGVETR